jgi:hypothetical protein
MLAVGMAILGPDVHRMYIVALARATAMSLGLIVGSVVVLTGIGIHAKAVRDQVNIQLKRMR